MKAWTMFLVLGALVGCARTAEPLPGARADVGAPQDDVGAKGAEVAVAPAVSKASGKRIGIAVAGNMYGELEPCG